MLNPLSFALFKHTDILSDVLPSYDWKLLNFGIMVNCRTPRQYQVALAVRAGNHKKIKRILGV